MTRPAPPCVLVADVGGTFARFALAPGGRRPGPVLTLARDSAADLAALCAQARRRLASPVVGAAIAVAAPVSGGRAHMTNVGWDVDERSLAEALSLDRILLINDFAALALSLPALAPADVLPVPPGNAAAAGLAPRVVFGPGTGLGVAALFFDPDGRPLPIASEGGHIGFAPATGFEARVRAHAATRFEHVSWERILSGPGLELIDEVSRRELGGPAGPRTAQQIVEAAQAGTCRAATHSLGSFAGLLGSFGGDLALMFRATGGVVIGGGIAARIAPLISPTALRERFRQKGRFSAWLDALPLSLLLSPNAALSGAAYAFAERFPETADAATSE